MRFLHHTLRLLHLVASAEKRVFYLFAVGVAIMKKIYVRPELRKHGELKGLTFSRRHFPHGHI
jgi:hypothetical protein